MVVDPADVAGAVTAALFSVPTHVIPFVAADASKMRTIFFWPSTALVVVRVIVIAEAEEFVKFWTAWFISHVPALLETVTV